MSQANSESVVTVVAKIQKMARAKFCLGKLHKVTGCTFSKSSIGFSQNACELHRYHIPSLVYTARGMHVFGLCILLALSYVFCVCRRLFLLHDQTNKTCSFFAQEPDRV